MRWLFLLSGGIRRRQYWLVTALFLSSTASMAAKGLTFDEALSTALRESAEVQAEAASVSAARQAEGPADALPDPTLILGLDNVPIEGPDRYSLSRDFMTMQRVGVTQRFPNRSKLRARASVASHQVGLAESSAASTRLMVLRQTAQAWIARHSLEQQLQLLNQLIEENRLLEQAVKARLSSGQGSALESVAPRQEHARLLNRRDLLEARRHQAIAQLTRWTGESGQRAVSGSAPEFMIDAAGLLTKLHKHPELEMAVQQTRITSAAVDEARAAKKPDWALTLAYMDREDFSDMAMLQVNIDLPLFSGSRQSPRIASAEAERLASVSRAEAIRREHESMLNSQLAYYERTERVLSRQTDVLLPLAEEKVALATAAWRAGKGSLADVIQTRSELLDASLAVIELTAERDQTAAALHFTYVHHATMDEEENHAH